MNLAPPQNLCREGYFKYDSFCAQSNCYVCGRGQWEDRVSILFVVVAPPEWSNYICIMDSAVSPLLPCLAWQASCLIYLLVTEGGMMESFWRVGLCSSFSRVIFGVLRFSFVHLFIHPSNQQGAGCVSHCGLVIYILKVCILRQKKKYGNSNISPCKNIIFKKIL
jgi:hypothetical protein